MSSPIFSPLVSSGYPALDQLLPAGGFERGTLVEWLNAVPGIGGARLALEVARQAAEGGGAIVVLDRKRWFYPVAALELGIDLRQLIVVLARNSKDEIWAVDQALRCSGVAAVWAAVEQLDWRAYRRLQLAAESSHVLGLLIRPPTALKQPSWSHLRLFIEPCSTASEVPAVHDTQPVKEVQRLRVRLLRYKSPYCLASINQDFENTDPATPDNTPSPASSSPASSRPASSRPASSRPASSRPASSSVIVELEVPNP